MSERAAKIMDCGQEALTDDDSLAALVQALGGPSRRARQDAAAALALVAREDGGRLADSVDELIDALNRPEAQTRWECLDALSLLVDVAGKKCDKAIAGAEAALFDEDSGPVRLAAMRFLCKYGAATPARSKKVWSLIDEGIQCYHGDLEFSQMLSAISDFGEGKISPEVRRDLIDRLSFDATSGKGAIKSRAAQIIEAARAAGKVAPQEAAPSAD